jgi:hypothetical protein
MGILDMRGFRNTQYMLILATTGILVTRGHALHGPGKKNPFMRWLLVFILPLLVTCFICYSWYVGVSVLPSIWHRRVPPVHDEAPARVSDAVYRAPPDPETVPSASDLESGPSDPETGPSDSETGPSDLETVPSDSEPVLSLPSVRWYREAPYAPTSSTETLGIVTATYYRTSGKTLSYLKRVYQCILNQSYPHWRWFLVGDAYQNKETGDADDVVTWLETLSDARISWSNLDEPGERGVLPESYHLWCSAGATAMNEGMRQVVEAGLSWYVHLDDDDMWSSDHLAVIVDAIETFPEAQCVYTQGFYAAQSQHGFPPSSARTMVLGLPPRAEGALHSALALKVNEVPVRHRIHPTMASDAALWEELYERSIPTVFVPYVTVFYSEHIGTEVRRPLEEAMVSHRLYLGTKVPPGWLSVVESESTEPTWRGAMTTPQRPSGMLFSCIWLSEETWERCADKEQLVADLVRSVRPSGSVWVPAAATNLMLHVDRSVSIHTDRTYGVHTWRTQSTMVCFTC